MQKKNYLKKQGFPAARLAFILVTRWTGNKHFQRWPHTVNTSLLSCLCLILCTICLNISYESFSVNVHNYYARFLFESILYMHVPCPYFWLFSIIMGQHSRKNISLHVHGTSLLCRYLHEHMICTKIPYRLSLISIYIMSVPSKQTCYIGDDQLLPYKTGVRRIPYGCPYQYIQSTCVYTSSPVMVQHWSC